MPDSLEVTARHFLWDEPSQSSLRDANSLSQNLTVLPAPSKREPLARRKLCTLAGNFSVLPKAPSQRGLSSAARLGEFAPGAPASSSFSGVENCNFPRLFHTEKRQRPGVENLGPAIPDWRKINRRSGTVCRMQRKSFDFLFYKRQNACIFIQNFPESGCLNYGAYRADPFLLLKTQWKKWKTSRKTRPFLHKSG